MATVPIHRRVSNPHAKKASKPSMNAAERKAFADRMAKARKKKNPTNATKRKPRKASNPKKRKNPSCAPRRRNPSILSNPKELGINIVTALLSAVATKQLPQMVLKEGNTGWKGYLANVIAGAASVFGAHELVGSGAAQAAAVGSGVIVLDRVLTERFSPIGQYLALTGIGDATAATHLGEVSDGFYIHPTIYTADGKPIIPHEITDAAVQEFQKLSPSNPAPARRMLAAGDPAMSGTPKSRFASRW